MADWPESCRKKWIVLILGDHTKYILSTITSIEKFILNTIYYTLIKENVIQLNMLDINICYLLKKGLKSGT
jgi:hypothetical protein